MSKSLVLFLIVLFASCALVSAQDSAPFAELDRHVKTTQNGYFGGEEATVTLFNNERKRLGKNFESALLKYLGEDLDKHYWISLYVEVENYLQGNERLPQLSLRIKQKGLAVAET